MADLNGGSDFEFGREHEAPLALSSIKGIGYWTLKSSALRIAKRLPLFFFFAVLARASRAFDIARRDPPSGISPEEAVTEIGDVLGSIGDTCPAP